jgi:hypothetical protein
MTKDEALKMCLEYIETNAQGSKFAILIKEALAQPEPEYVAFMDVATNDTSQERVDKTSESVHEPIGYLCENAVGHKYFRWKKPPSTFKPIPLYTAPQKTEYVAFMDVPHRPWVGLTKEERHEISMANRPYCADVMAAHEEELKRRNYG